MYFPGWRHRIPRKLTQFSAGLLLAVAATSACRTTQEPLPAGQYETPGIPYSLGLLWKVTGPEPVAPSYIFGTIHINDPRVTKLPRIVELSFNSARTFLPEIALHQENLFRLSTRMFYGDGEASLEQTLGEDLFERVSVMLGLYGIPRYAASRMRPWAVIMVLSNPPPKQRLTPQEEPVLDVMLYQRAQSLGMEIVELETVDEQVAIFDGLSEAEQIELIEEAVLDLRTKDNIDLELLIRSYRARNLGPVIASLQEQGRESALLARVHERLLDNRNRQMVQRMDLHLRNGAAFVAVGALHLPGEVGILKLLELQGYTLTRMY